MKNIGKQHKIGVKMRIGKGNISINIMAAVDLLYKKLIKTSLANDLKKSYENVLNFLFKIGLTIPASSSILN